MNIYPELALDFYKTGHIYQYPKGTQFVYSNFTCRSSKWANVLPDFDKKTVFFGLQGVCQWLLSDLWTQNFFQVPKRKVLDRYKRAMDEGLGPNAIRLDHIAELHDLGYLPIRIKALKEGSRVNIRVPMWTIVNTVFDFYWITNYLETQLSAECWKPIVSATTAYEYRRLFEKYGKLTGMPKEFIQWQGHDFSARGLSGIYDDNACGSAHLLSFTGTDTVHAIEYLREYYPGTGLIGGSVPATEHSVMCMGGKDSEILTFKRLIEEVYPNGIVSIVSDTWDFWQVITQFTVALKDTILGRNGKVVFRPDSGNPADIICGNPNAVPGSPEYKGAIECLWDVFGGTITDAGYKLLDSHVGTIYGDSITLDVAQQIVQRLEKKGFASQCVLGIGSFTYQYVTRDTFGAAIKATWGMVDGEPRELFKAPKTDTGTKNSLCGLIRVEFENGNFVAYDRQTPEQEKQGLLETVFENGYLKRIQSYNEVRQILGVL